MTSAVGCRVNMGSNKLQCLQTIVCGPTLRMRHLVGWPPLIRLRIGRFMMILKVQCWDFLFLLPANVNRWLTPTLFRSHIPCLPFVFAQSIFNMLSPLSLRLPCLSSLCKLITGPLCPASLCPCERGQWNNHGTIICITHLSAGPDADDHG